MVRALLIAAIGVLLLAPAAEAKRPPWLGKQRARVTTERILGHDQIAYLYDRELIRGWVIEPARQCQRLGRARVRCAFSVTLSNEEVCGDWMTIIRRRAYGDQPAYLGWRIRVDALAENFPANCDRRAAQQADIGLPRREIRDQEWG